MIRLIKLYLIRLVTAKTDQLSDCTRMFVYVCYCEFFSVCLFYSLHVLYIFTVFCLFFVNITS